MKKAILVISAILATGSMAAVAGSAEDRWNKLPQERQAMVKERASNMGYDLTTEEGRTGFKQAMKDKRSEKATELGYDLATVEGREGFREHRQEQRKAHAAELGYDMSSKEGRSAFQEHRQQQREVMRGAMSALSVEDRTALRTEMEGLSRQERRDLMADRFGK